MIWLIIYIVGVVLCFTILLCEEINENDITVGDMCEILTLSLLSWCTILLMLLVIIPWDEIGEKCRIKEKYLDKVIFKKK